MLIDRFRAQIHAPKGPRIICKSWGCEFHCSVFIYILMERRFMFSFISFALMLFTTSFKTYFGIFFVVFLFLVLLLGTALLSCMVDADVQHYTHSIAFRQSHGRVSYLWVSSLANFQDSAWPLGRQKRHGPGRPAQWRNKDWVHIERFIMVNRG